MNAPAKRIALTQLPLAVLFLLLLLALTVGCSPRRARTEDESKPGFQRRSVDRYLVVVVDLSGSFRDKMARDTDASKHLMRTVGEFFQSGAGEDRHDRILLAQISAATLPILFEGTPREFTERFKTPDELRKLFLERSNPHGSRVYDSLSDAFELVLGSDVVVRGNTKLGMLILSDMIDTQRKPESEKRVHRNFRDWASAGGAIAVHWLPQNEVMAWREYLRFAGYRPEQYSVSPDFNASAPVLRF